MSFREPDNWEFKQSGGGKLPPGNYRFCITDAETKVNDYGEKYVSVEFTVIDGECANRKMWQNYRFASQNVEAAEKAYQKWVNLCANVGEKISPNEPHKLKQRVTTLGIDIFETTNDQGQKREYQYISEYPDAQNVNGATPQTQTNGAAPASQGAAAAQQPHPATAGQAQTPGLDDIPF